MVNCSVISYILASSKFGEDDRRVVTFSIVYSIVERSYLYVCNLCGELAYE
jgi:hypothetical protein